MSPGYIPVKAEDWAKMVEATKVAADLLSENKRLKDDLAKWVNLSAEHEKEVAQLQAKVADLEARCRLLRRLGDEMYEALDDGEPNPILVDWYFAKQGM